jgi:cytidine deaminase
MKRNEFSISYECYADITELSDTDASLLHQARLATQLAYAPYSDFKVGAVALMPNGEMVSGSNQENASYPAGICAERVLLSTASSIHPGKAIKTMAISYIGKGKNSNRPVAPCGICRQSLMEFEQRFNQPIRLILGGMEGEVYIFDTIRSLLPFEFSGDDLK